jgi:hypothetical protein
MSCDRCCGLMVRQADQKLRWRYWRCTACGERIDHVIEQNRRAHHHFYRRPSPKLVAEILFQQLISAQTESA